MGREVGGGFMFGNACKNFLKKKKEIFTGIRIYRYISALSAENA